MGKTATLKISDGTSAFLDGYKTLGYKMLKDDCIVTLGKKYNFSGNIGGIYIKEVIYNKPATIILWSDGSKTVSKCSEEDTYSEEVGLMTCMLKRLLTNKELKRIFNDWVPEQTSMGVAPQIVRLPDVMKKNKRGK